VFIRRRDYLLRTHSLRTGDVNRNIHISIFFRYLVVFIWLIIVIHTSSTFSDVFLDMIY